MSSLGIQRHLPPCPDYPHDYYFTFMYFQKVSKFLTCISIDYFITNVSAYALSYVPYPNLVIPYSISSCYGFLKKVPSR